MERMNAERELTDRRRDHTKTIVVTVSLVLICGGIVGSGWMVLESIGNQFTAPGNATATVSAPAALMAEATATAEPTATETPLPLPTLDDRYIKQQAELARIAQDEASAKQLAVNAQSTAVSNLVTEAAVQAGTPTMQAIIEGTRQAVMTQKAIIGMTETPAARSFMAQMATATQQQAVTDRADMVAGGWQIVGMVAVSALILAVIYVIAVTVAYRVNVGGVGPEPVTDAGDGDDFLKSMIPETQVSSAGNAGFMHEIQITNHEYYALVAAAKRLGGSFSRRKLNGDNPQSHVYFTEGRAEEILAMLRGPGSDRLPFARYEGQMTNLTETGWKWLKLNPTSPPPDIISPENLQNAGIPHPTPPQETGGVVAEGQKWTPEQYTRADETTKKGKTR